jgi:signal transduction histidine kinase
MQAQHPSNLAARTTSPLPSPPSPSPIPASADSAPPASIRAPSLANSTGLAHDAGNLLAALGLYCDLLNVAGVLRPEHQHYGAELRLISDRSSSLIQRLLAAPVTAAPIAIRPDPAQPSADPLPLPSTLLRCRNARASDIIPPSPNHAAMLRSLAPVLERIAAGAATVTVTCPASLPALDFPSEIIERITVNLVRNAAEAIRLQQGSAPPSTLPPCGEIQVSLAEVGGRVQLSVEDNGPGMPPAIAAAYLQPSPLPLGASRGLGHRIIHELAASSEGQLSIRVRPGRGTIFCLKWPITLPPSAEAASVPSRTDV